IERTRNEILKELDPNFTPPEGEAEEAAGSASGGKKDVKTPALRAFGRDLTDLAKKNELDPVIGRKNEIERVIQVLCRRTKRNPIHRRVAYDCRSRFGRGGDGRKQHHQAGLEPGRVAMCGRHHLERISQVHRERRGPGATVPDRESGSADGRGSDPDFKGVAAEIRGASQSEADRRSARDRGETFRTLHHWTIFAG